MTGQNEVRKWATMMLRDGERQWLDGLRKAAPYMDSATRFLFYELVTEALVGPRTELAAGATALLTPAERYAAEVILDRPYADPDDDAAIMARAALGLAALADTKAVSMVDVYGPILEDAVREMEAQGLAIAATYRKWLSDPAGFRPYAELAKSIRHITAEDPQP